MSRDDEQDLIDVAKFAVGSLVACLLIVCLALLVGCAAPIATTPSSQRTVFSAESDFAAALRVAVAYEALPDCSTGATLCSKQAVVSEVTGAARAARASLDTAEGLVRSGSSSEQVSVLVAKAYADVAAFKALAGTLGK